MSEPVIPNISKATYSAWRNSTQTGASAFVEADIRRYFQKMKDEWKLRDTEPLYNAFKCAQEAYEALCGDWWAASDTYRPLMSVKKPGKKMKQFIADVCAWVERAYEAMTQAKERLDKAKAAWEAKVKP